jgi:tRNA A-37 threonylcarbamoyl transferase component Bud32
MGSGETGVSRVKDNLPTQENSAVTRIDSLPAPPAPPANSSRDPAIGDLLAGRFRLVAKLGEGGMGEVFVAENEAIGRRVALKLLKAPLVADDSFRKRFQQEAMAVAAIEHRNVAHFLDLVVGDPTFLVMELVEGPTLAKVLRREKRLSIPRAVNITKRVAWALDAAHQANVIHRDVKPSNVVLAPDPELGEEPKLIDFGLAKLPTVVGVEALTRSGQIVGTPAYMSPEQIANKDVDARSEVYALGCLLFHMLAGRPPFAGGDDVQTLFQQIEIAPPPLREFVPEAPEKLQAIVARALAKAPDARYQSMRELIAALDDIDRRAPDPSSPSLPAIAAPPPRRLRPWLTAAAACVGGALVTFLAVGARHGHGATAGGLLLVSSRPSNAQVQLDGVARSEATPTAIHGIAAGTHRLRVSLPGRDPVEQTVVMGADERTAVDIALNTATRPLEVVTVPSTARVWLDGEELPGETPMTLHVTDDDFHLIRLERVGFEVATIKLAPEDRQRQTVVTLQPETRPGGLLTVSSNAAGEIFVDGADTGYVAPTFGIRVATGFHDVELRDSAGLAGPKARVEVHHAENVHLMLNAADQCKK